MYADKNTLKIQYISIISCVLFCIIITLSNTQIIATDNIKNWNDFINDWVDTDWDGKKSTLSPLILAMVRY